MSAFPSPTADLPPGSLVYQEITIEVYMLRVVLPMITFAAGAVTAVILSIVFSEQISSGIKAIEKRLQKRLKEVKG